MTPFLASVLELLLVHFSSGACSVSQEMTDFHSGLLCVGSLSFNGNHACAVIPSFSD